MYLATQSQGGLFVEDRARSRRGFGGVAEKSCHQRARSKSGRDIEFRPSKTSKSFTEERHVEYNGRYRSNMSNFEADDLAVNFQLAGHNATSNRPMSANPHSNTGFKDGQLID